ncbi:MAG: hypothetical protein ACREM1_00030 [Longimicrobiales bacterium]
MLAVTLTAILFLAHQLVGLPFIPFEVFDWTARLLPGAVITFGIDAIVIVIRALDIGPTSEVAKLAEQTMAIGGLLVTGLLAGVVLFAVMRERDAARAVPVGLVLGTIIGVPVALIVLTGTSRCPPAARSLRSGRWRPWWASEQCWDGLTGGSRSVRAQRSPSSPTSSASTAASS